MTLYSWIKKRESGFLGGYDSIYKSLYNAIAPYARDGSTNDQPFERSEFGGVFNLEFNDG